MLYLSPGGQRCLAACIAFGYHAVFLFTKNLYFDINSKVLNKIGRKLDLMVMFLVPILGPNTEKSVLDIRKDYPEFFDQEDLVGKFLSQDKVRKGFLFSNRIIDGSLNRTSVSQFTLVQRPYTVPNAPELVWAILNLLKMKSPVFPGFARCSSINSTSRYVAVGVVGGKILIRTDMEDNQSYRDVGVVAIQKF